MGRHAALYIWGSGQWVWKRRSRFVFQQRAKLRTGLVGGTVSMACLKGERSMKAPLCCLGNCAFLQFFSLLNDCDE